MTPRLVAAVVGVAFLVAGLLIVLLPLHTGTPLGFDFSCGNGLGLGYDPVDAQAQGAGLPAICSRLRAERLTWAAPVAGFGALVVVAGALLRREDAD
ncbi:hypothetical protein [Actinosynnema sp. NPDC020468]|uniref:hypothetical protein n=1 Tax=Actinosynnema sp. NPDC020468 TaxID=3154488 RepID=UPI0033F5DC6A